MPRIHLCIKMHICVTSCIVLCTIYFSGNRKKEIDDAVVNFIIKDSQLFSVVEDVGFKELVAKLDPTYTLPTRKAVKNMVYARYEEEKEQAKAELQGVETVSLTSDMWTSINMEAFLAVTCHYINRHDQLATLLLGVKPFPMTHTAAHIAAEIASMIAEWGLTNKIRCIVTDSASNMIATVNNLNLRQSKCIAHCLNLVVKNSIDATSGLDAIRAMSRKIVTFFKTSTTAKERLCQTQQQLGHPVKKLKLEVDTRWNSTLEMLQRLYEQREAVASALATLHTDLTPLTNQQHEITGECIKVCNAEIIIIESYLVGLLQKGLLRALY